MAISATLQGQILEPLELELQNKREHESRELAKKVGVADEDRLNDIIRLPLDILSMHQCSLPGVEIGWRHVSRSLVRWENRTCTATSKITPSAL